MTTSSFEIYTAPTCPTCGSTTGAAQAPVDTSKKQVRVIVNDRLAPGFAVNTGTALGGSLGKLHSEMVGRDLLDSEGRVHHGITTMPIPILKASAERLKELRERARKFEPELTVLEVISATKSTRSYEEYAEAFQTTPSEELEFFGVAVFGDKKTVARLTGDLPLFR